MSKLHFLIKHGTLDQAKKAIESSDKERLGHATSMVKLLDRMQAEGDPDYEKVRKEHMDEYASDRIKSSWIVGSRHATSEHLKAIADNFPHMMDRVVKNKNADEALLRHVHDKSLARNDYESRRQIPFHSNAPEDLVRHMAENDPSMTVRAFAKTRLDSGQNFKGR